MVIKKSRKCYANTAFFNFVFYSSIAVIFLVLLILFLFPTEIALGIPNRYYPGLGIVNHPPVVKAGPDQMVKENETVVLHGIANDSDPGDKISYSWRQIAGPAAKLSRSNTMNPSFIAPNVSADTQLRFALTATDNKGATSITPGIVTITIKHINHAPIANAGTDQTVSPGYVTTLDGTNSYDLDNDASTYIWVQTGGPHVILNRANTSIATFTAPSNLSTDTTLAFRLIVKDDKNATGADDVKVIDKYIPPPNQPPIASAGTDQTVNVGNKVTLDGSGSKDPDGSITSYSWKQTIGPIVILSSTDMRYKTFSAPHVLSTTTLVFTLTVTDDKGVSGASDSVAITVKPQETTSTGSNKPSEPMCQYIPGPNMEMVQSCKAGH